MISSMYPILARYGSLFIYSFTLVMALGIILGISYLIHLTQRTYLPDWFDALLIVIFAALIAGRIGFIFSRWGYFQENPSEIWHIWHGGLSYHAALLGGILALFAWTIAANRSFYRYAALFAPAFILITVFGWTACWLEGCAYGRETVLGLMAADLPDEYGVFAVRYQTQMIGFLLALIAFLFIEWYRKRQPAPHVFWMALAGASFVHLLISLLRGDPTIVVGNLRLDTVLSALLAAISLLLLQYEKHAAK